MLSMLSCIEVVRLYAISQASCEDADSVHGGVEEGGLMGTVSLGEMMGRRVRRGKKREKRCIIGREQRLPWRYRTRRGVGGGDYLV